MAQPEIDGAVIETYLERKLNEFQHKTDQQLKPEERQAVIANLIYGQKLDLSGVTAIRGFLYQYYVAVAYMVDMCSGENWWNEVVFELLDDIALVGPGKLRFVQVKTIKEDSANNQLSFSSFYNRNDDGLGWLDKLFLLNTAFFNEENKPTMNNRFNFRSCDLQFEIATNAGYSKKTADYSKNDVFDLKDREEDTLDEKLRVSFTKNVTHRGETFVLDNRLYNQNGRGVDWFLKRFRVNHLGPFVEIEKMIINRLCKIMPQNMGVIQPFVAAIVLQRLLQEIVNNTHNDSITDLRKFIFSREQVSEWIARYQQEGFNIIENEIEVRSLKKKFEQIFIDIRRSINDEWDDDRLKSEMIETSNWIEDEFIRQLDVGNVHVYENFLNKLFNLRFSRAPFPLDGYTGPNNLLMSLKQLILIFTVYNGRELYFDESKLLFKQVQGRNRVNWEVFSMYNAQRQDLYDFAVERIKNTYLSCAYSQAKGEIAYCFVTNAKKENNQHKKHWSSIVSITQPEVEERLITGKSINIKFRPGAILEKFWLESSEEEDYNTFKSEHMFDRWVSYLTNEEEE